jgi:hypothetical protein
MNYSFDSSSVSFSSISSSFFMIIRKDLIIHTIIIIFSFTSLHSTLKMNLFRGSWNVSEDNVPLHSPVRLLQKLAAYRASTGSSSIPSSPSPSPQNERKPTILTESTNFFSRLWRSSVHRRTPSPNLIASHEAGSASFDQIPEPSLANTDMSSGLPLPSKSNRRMSFIREISPKGSSQLFPFLTPPPPPPPPFQPQPTSLSTVTDPSFEDTISEHPCDTASENYSQSFETNIDSSNPGIIDDQDDEQNSQSQLLTYDERHRKLSLTPKPMKSFPQQLSSLPMRTSDQHHNDSLPSPEANIDVSMVG